MTGLEEGTLPFRGDGVAASRDGDTVLILEGGKGDKVAVQKHVERLHDLVGISSTLAGRCPGVTHDGEAEDEGPHAGHGMALDRLPQAHLMLVVLATVGLGHEVRVDQDLGMTNALLLEVLHLDMAVILVQLLLGLDGA